MLFFMVMGHKLSHHVTHVDVGSRRTSVCWPAVFRRVHVQGVERVFLTHETFWFSLSLRLMMVSLVLHVVAGAPWWTPVPDLITQWSLIKRHKEPRGSRWTDASIKDGWRLECV